MKQKLDLINNKLIDSIQENLVDSFAKVKQFETKELIDKIDEFDKASVNIDKKLFRVRRHNAKLEEVLPQMDAQIEQLEAALAKLDETELTAENLV